MAEEGEEQKFIDDNQYQVIAQTTSVNQIKSESVSIDENNVLTIKANHKIPKKSDFKNGMKKGGMFSLEDGDKGWVYLSAPDGLNVEDAVSVEKCEGEKEDEKKGKRNMALYLVLAAIVLLAIYFLVIKKPARRQRGGKRRRRRRRRSRK